jgi:hypothetical protein
MHQVEIEGKVSLRIKNKLGWIFPITFLFYSFIKAWKEIHNQYFWYDESGQFWMSQGLNHYSPPLVEAKSILSIVTSNANFSFDPGGFTLLVRFWVEISTNYVWLRTLPQVFFFLSFLGIFLVLRIFRINNFTSSLVLLIYSVGVNGIDGSFFRPYSAEMFAFILTLYFTLKLISNETKAAKYVNYILILAIFGIWMRYGAIIWSLSILLYLFVFRKIHKTRKAIVTLQTASLIFLYFASIVFIYFFSFRHQTGDSTAKFYYTYLSSSPLFLINRYNLVFYCFIIVCIAYTRIRVSSNLRNLVIEFHGIYLLILGSYVLMSAFGVYPWNPWSHVNAPISIGCLILVAISFKGLDSKPLLIPTTLTTIVLILYLSIASHRGITNWGFSSKPKNLTNFFELQNNPCEGKKFLVNSWDSPAVRFYFEIIRPELVSRFQYPAAFTFLSPRIEGDLQLKSLDGYLQESCALIIPGLGERLDLKDWVEVTPGEVWVRKNFS